MGHLTSIILCSALLINHCNSYVLLTANVEDVQSIAQQVANSPVVEQLKNVWRRASKTFQANLESPKMRTDNTGDNETVEDREAAEDNNEENDKVDDREVRAQRREAVEQLMNLGRNASLYLGSMKKIIDKI